MNDRRGEWHKRNRQRLREYAREGAMLLYVLGCCLTTIGFILQVERISVVILVGMTTVLIGAGLWAINYPEAE